MEKQYCRRCEIWDKCQGDFIMEVWPKDSVALDDVKLVCRPKSSPTFHREVTLAPHPDDPLPELPLKTQQFLKFWHWKYDGLLMREGSFLSMY